jgi:hypothetical protein
MYGLKPVPFKTSSYALSKPAPVPFQKPANFPVGSRVALCLVAKPSIV